MNIIDHLRTEHMRFIAAAERIGKLAVRPEIYVEGASAEREALMELRRLMKQVERHEGVERRLLFPELRRRLPGFARFLASLSSEHREIDAAAAALRQAARKRNRLPARWLRYKILRFKNLLEQHIMLEDSEILSKADRHVPVAESERLGRKAQGGL